MTALATGARAMAFSLPGSGLYRGDQQGSLTETDLRGRPLTFALRGAIDQADGASGVNVTELAMQLVEFGDYECQQCRQAHQVVRLLLQRYGSQLQFRFRHFPLSPIHPYSKHAAEAAVSVRSQAGEEAFWAMHDAIFGHEQGDLDVLDDAHLARYAEAVGADGARVLSDLDTGKFEETVEVDFVEGVRMGVYDTPTFFINGERFNGDWSITALGMALELAATRSATAAGTPTRRPVKPRSAPYRQPNLAEPTPPSEFTPRDTRIAHGGRTV